MTQAQLQNLEAVKLAESIGFMSYGENASNYRHFYFFLPDSSAHGDHEFSVHQEQDKSVHYRVREIGECGWTTPYLPDVLKRLKRIYKRMKRRGQHD